MTHPQPIRVMIVEDHPIMRFGIAAILKSEAMFDVVADTDNGDDARKLFQTHKPDVTVMDLQLPDKSGAEIIRTLKKLRPEAKFLVLTTYEGDEDIFRALQAGATGYIIKGMPREALIAGVKQVHAGRQYVPHEVKDRLSQRNPLSTLSERESQVLQLMAEGSSNKQIASRLGVTEATVKSHVSVILSHLNVQDRTQAVLSALQRGLVHPQQRPRVQ